MSRVKYTGNKPSNPSKPMPYSDIKDKAKCLFSSG